LTTTYQWVVRFEQATARAQVIPIQSNDGTSGRISRRSAMGTLARSQRRCHSQAGREGNDAVTGV
jgi:hypothetical protein